MFGVLLFLSRLFDTKLVKVYITINMELNKNNVIRKYVHEQGRICTRTSYLPVITYGFDAADYV